jgi:hypothetical protein
VHGLPSRQALQSRISPNARISLPVAEAVVGGTLDSEPIGVTASSP